MSPATSFPPRGTTRRPTLGEAVLRSTLRCPGGGINTMPTSGMVHQMRYAAVPVTLHIWIRRIRASAHVYELAVVSSFGGPGRGSVQVDHDDFIENRVRQPLVAMGRSAPMVGPRVVHVAGCSCGCSPRGGLLREGVSRRRGSAARSCALRAGRYPGCERHHHGVWIEVLAGTVAGE